MSTNTNNTCPVLDPPPHKKGPQILTSFNNSLAYYAVDLLVKYFVVLMPPPLSCTTSYNSPKTIP